jgi:hypothetical protein
MKIIKLIMALGIFICLFLPLSQCTGVPGGHPEPGEFDQMIKESEEEDVQENDSNIHRVISDIDDVTDIGNIPLFLAFILPLLFCVSVIARKWKLLVLILQTANQTWLIYVTFILVWYFSEPLWGGWLLTFCTVGYSLMTILEWIYFFRRKQLT